MLVRAVHADADDAVFEVAGNNVAAVAAVEMLLLLLIPRRCCCCCCYRCLMDACVFFNSICQPILVFGQYSKKFIDMTRSTKISCFVSFKIRFSLFSSSSVVVGLVGRFCLKRDAFFIKYA